MIVDFEYNPILEDYNKNRTLKIPAIMKILENAGTKHTDLVGDNILDSSNKGLTWILTDWYLEINFFPSYGSKILSKTWSQLTTTTFGCARDFELYADGKQAAIASTRWVLLDLKTERPTKIDKEWFTIYQSEDKSVFDNPRLPKTENITEFSNEKELEIRRGDIDFNDHVHNLTYLDYALETIPQDVYDKMDFTKIRISYKSAVKQSDKIVCKYAFVNEKHIVNIFDQNNELKTAIELS